MSAFVLHVNYRETFLRLWAPCVRLFECGQNKEHSMRGDGDRDSLCMTSHYSDSSVTEQKSDTPPQHGAQTRVQWHLETEHFLLLVSVDGFYCQEKIIVRKSPVGKY